MTDIFIQMDLQFREDSTEPLKVKGLGQGPNHDSLMVLEFALTFSKFVAQTLNQ